MQLTYVARPGALTQKAPSLGGRPRSSESGFVRQTRGKSTHDRNQVTHALAQRGDVDLDDGEAIVKVSAEPRVACVGLEVTVGGGDDAYIDRHVGFAADGPHATLLQRAQ